MKKILFVLIVMLSFATLTQGQDTTSTSATSTIPSSDMKTLDGKTVNSRAILQDSVPIILSFWATWCKPCIKELTAINDEMEEWKKKAQFRVVAISIDDARTTNMVKNLVNARGWTFEVYLDANSDFKKLMNVAQPPHTFIIYQGKVVYQHTSYAEGDEEELFEVVKKHQP
jgi:cytochrome c biogenesis protein CcmG, thiol:disulfide interchange protein DsbE